MPLKMYKSQKSEFNVFHSDMYLGSANIYDKDVEKPTILAKKTLL